jgi:hypothetical protein
MAEFFHIAKLYFNNHKDTLFQGESLSWQTIFASIPATSGDRRDTARIAEDRSDIDPMDRE